MDKHPGSNTINPASYHGNPAARCSDRGVGGPCPHSLGSEAGTAGSRGGVSGDSASTTHQTHKRRLEGVLNKYTNLLQGWQNRYFVLDPDMGQLQYFVNEHSKNQKPRGSLPLIGASVALSDELPHMFTVHSATGEAYKLRASDAEEQQLWMSQMQLCARRHSDSSAKGRTLSFSVLPPPLSHRHPAPPVASSFTSSSPGTQRKPLYPGVGGVVTITHHRSPAAARRARTQNNQNYHPAPGRLSQVKEVMTQAEGQQKNLVNSIESLPSRGPLSSLDQDLLLLKATSAATLSCLGECLHMLQHNVSQVRQQLPSHVWGSVSTCCQPGTSAATLPCLGECLHMLQHNVSQVRQQLPSPVWGSVSTCSQPGTSAATLSCLGECLHMLSARHVSSYPLLSGGVSPHAVARCQPGTSAATLSCLGECLHMLQHNVSQVRQQLPSPVWGSVSTCCQPGTSAATLPCLGECLHMLQHNVSQVRQQLPSPVWGSVSTCCQPGTSAATLSCLGECLHMLSARHVSSYPLLSGGVSPHAVARCQPGTSAATLSCLGECLHMLWHDVSQARQQLPSSVWGSVSTCCQPGTSAATLSCLGECLHMLWHDVSQVRQQLPSPVWGSVSTCCGTMSARHVSSYPLLSGGVSPHAVARCQPGTSAATLSCLGECLHMLSARYVSSYPLLSGGVSPHAATQCQPGRAACHPGSVRQPGPESHPQTDTFSQSNSNISSQTHNHNQFKKQMSLDPNHVRTAPSDSFAGWSRSPSEKQVTSRGGTPLPHVPSPAHINKEVVSNSVPQQAPPTPESIDPSEEMTDTEDNEEEDLGVREDQRNIILHLLSQLKLGMDLTRVRTNT
ncbi:uncharacterized protein LOC116359258 [Oncorhynchus kisutch]|uniref:uncharacterized protein LOC116359258 n=1 Tax=Oncorhynchus kisutch TaxID=8019 RepID=UPI0012DED524|nr:uncharacterized protein LOC116359258 [Oncorhynchus kisutch]